MPSQLRSDTARANGARSKGPITAAGKSKAAQNALRHGLSAKRIVLPDESLTEYRALLKAYLEEFHPQTALQTELVTVMAAARWRLRRLTAIEASLFFNELHMRQERINEDLKDPTLDDRLAWIFKRLADNSQVPSLLSRYEATLTRTHDRASLNLSATSK